ESISYSPCGKYLASVGFGRAYVHDSSNGNLLYELSHDKLASEIVYSPCGKQFAISGPYGHKIDFYSSADGSHIRTLSNYLSVINSPCGKQRAFRRKDYDYWMNNLDVFNVDNGRLLYSLHSHSQAYSPCGKKLATADGRVCIYNSSDGTLLRS